MEKLLLAINLDLAFFPARGFQQQFLKKCSTSNVIKEQLNWIIMYLNLGAKVVFFP